MKIKRIISCIMIAAILMMVCLMSVSAYSASATLTSGAYYAKTTELGNANDAGEATASVSSTSTYSCKVSLMSYEGAGGARATVGYKVVAKGASGTTGWLSNSKPWLYGYLQPYGSSTGTGGSGTVWCYT